MPSAIIVSQQLALVTAAIFAGAAIYNVERVLAESMPITASAVLDF
jgi:hypothetical protein